MKRTLGDDDHLINVVGGCNSSQKQLVINNANYRTVKKFGRRCENYFPAPNISLPATMMCGNCINFRTDEKTNKNYCSIETE